MVNGQARHFSIQPFAYPQQHLTVPAKHVNPSKEQLARIQKRTCANETRVRKL